MSNTVKIIGQAGTQYTNKMWVTFDWTVQNNGTQPGDEGNINGTTTVHFADGSPSQSFSYEGSYQVLGSVSGSGSIGTLVTVPLQDTSLTKDVILKNISGSNDNPVPNLFGYLGPQNWLEPMKGLPSGILMFNGGGEEGLMLFTQVTQ